MSGEKRRQRLQHDFVRLQTLCRLNPDKIELEVDRRTDPPQQYRLTLHCRGVRRIHGEVKDIDEHRIGIALSPEYPNREPILQWQSPVYHPNIRVPNVCLLGQWNAKVPLDTVCVWLWDMARCSPGLMNIEGKWDEGAAEWVMTSGRTFPLDSRSLTVVPPDPRSVPVPAGEVIDIEVPT